jgi:hypothetical protein
MSTAHTPGPWVATPANSGEWNIDSVAPDDWCIARVMGGAGLEDPNGRSDANARLIAAAPDLLAALKMLDERGHTQATWDFAKRALAKAGA